MYLALLRPVSFHENRNIVAMLLGASVGFPEKLECLLEDCVQSKLDRILWDPLVMLHLVAETESWMNRLEHSAEAAVYELACLLVLRKRGFSELA